MIAVLGGIAGLGISAALFKYAPLPYVWIAACWFVYWLYASFRSPRFKIFCFNLAFIALVCGILECSAWFTLTKAADPSHQQDRGRIRHEGDYTDTKHYYARDDILGYAPLKNHAVGSRKYQGENVIYDVTYSIAPNGLRIAPTVAKGDNPDCVLFFGGSFTFGEGVNDRETLPYIVGMLAGAEVYNFGFHGYGPHQMLSALEHGLVEDLIQCRPTVAIYQAVQDHVPRVAGTVPWGPHSPRYVLTNDGVKYAGHFDDGLLSPQRIRRRQEIMLKKSFFYRKYFQHRRKLTTDKDIQLYLEVVDASRKRAEALYPGLDFHVILWDKYHQDGNFKKIETGLEERGLKLHLISRILPDYHENISHYEIAPADPHPNARTHELIAKYIVEHILQGDRK